MKKITFVIWMCLGLTSLAQAQGDIAQGEAKSATCVTCHNENGEALGYPKIDGQHASYLEKQLHEFKAAMTGGTGRANAVMGGMAIGLSDEDISDLSAYFASKTMSPNTTAPEFVDAGQSLYMGGDLERGIAACTACHGPRGNGQSLANFPKISSQYAPYIKSQLELFRSGERNNDLNGMMRNVAAKLSDDDIELLSQYLGGLH
ncbi:cytochrome c4 [Alginatibacterium sediminis]|uniref:Cytochrome c4 n=1 Tax=Alginatibacterium sediminis TaxID=2164068 RepID=A0A420EN60_9ALTE|nr:c-type cytochrome [Alginatibacterium sediminis]RKF22083.1 cytochrome c4 [Alginatibacterium sediminis]